MAISECTVTSVLSAGPTVVVTTDLRIADITEIQSVGLPTDLAAKTGHFAMISPHQGAGGWNIQSTPDGRLQVVIGAGSVLSEVKPGDRLRYERN